MEESPAVLSAAEVAGRAGVTEEDVQRMRSLGILTPTGGRVGFGAGDVRRVRLALACERAGLPMDAIAESVREGRLSFAFLDAVAYRRWAERSDRTYADVSEEAGIPFDTLRISLEAMGFASMEPGDRIRADELEIVPLVQLAFGSGVLDEAWIVRLGRAYAGGLQRINKAENEVYHWRFEVPFLEQGLTQAQAMERASAMAGQYNDLVDRALLAMLRRQQELQWTEHLVEHIEDDLEASGRLGRPERLPAMAFVDLAGYTRLTEERGDEAAAELASQLAVLVDRETRGHGGTPVKWLGDGVMVAFRDPGGAVRSALHPVRAVPEAGLPPAHVGLAAGRVVAYGGDYFGRTVNMAARLSARARAGRVLVNEAVVEAAGAADATFTELEAMDLKGFPDPVRVFEAAPGPN
ncbi:MAG: adenylate/guanylate cyclase domain-containing protein [Actinomycetota bacterium]